MGALGVQIAATVKRRHGDRVRIIPDDEKSSPGNVSVRSGARRH
jgi:hypothetical protein